MKKQGQFTDHKGRHRGTTRLGREMLAALHELQDTLEAGIPLAEKYTIDVVSIPEPHAYGPKEIKTLRARLGLSQAIFARLIGASAILVQKWEGGDRNPGGMARRLMDDIGADPQRFFNMLAARRKAG